MSFALIYYGRKCKIKIGWVGLSVASFEHLLLDIRLSPQDGGPTRNYQKT
jgi:hypothetical protein